MKKFSLCYSHEESVTVYNYASGTMDVLESVGSPVSIVKKADGTLKEAVIITSTVLTTENGDFAMNMKINAL